MPKEKTPGMLIIEGAATETRSNRQLKIETFVRFKETVFQFNERRHYRNRIRRPDNGRMSRLYRTLGALPGYRFEQDRSAASGQNSHLRAPSRRPAGRSTAKSAVHDELFG